MKETKKTENENLKDLNIPNPNSSEIDFDAFRLSQDFESMVGVKKETLIIPVRKPDKQRWFQVRSGEEWRTSFALIEIKEDREFYLVSPNLVPELINEYTPMLLVLCQTREGVIFFWPIRLPGRDGKLDPWNTSALEIVKNHAEQWIRVMANRDLGAYDVYTTPAELPQPIWPQENLNFLLQKAFKGKIIENLDHPLIQKLKGLI